jgi:segregation and condensation protein B
MRTLLERGLVRMLGRKAEAGRPILYGTTGEFLEHFGFKDLGDLPTLREIDELIGAQKPAGSPPPAERPADASGTDPEAPPADASPEPGPPSATV